MNEAIRLLVVDDDDSVRSSLCRYFDEYDFEVTATDSAEAALAVLAKQRFDAGIIDMRLPGMSGDSLILAAHRLCPEMRVLIYTGSSAYCVSNELEDIGVSMDRVVQKPVGDLGILKEKINHLIEGRRP